MGRRRIGIANVSAALLPTIRARYDEAMRAPAPAARGAIDVAALEAAPTKRRSRGKRDSSAEDLFAFQCRAMRLPAIERQYRIEKTVGKFANRPGLHWRLDCAFPEFALVVEIDGGIWTEGAHAHPLDVIRNMHKQNDCALRGWTVLRFSTDEVKSGHAIAYVRRVLAEKGWNGG